MHIVHVVPSFYPAYIYGGPIQSVYGMCKSLAVSKCEVRVLTTDANGPDRVLDVEKDQEVKLTERLHVRYCRRRFLHTVSYTFLKQLPAYVQWSDVVHLTAVYSFPTIPTLLACKRFDKPVVWSPRGALQRWGGTTRVWQKALWEQVCWLVAPKRLVLHVTSEEEADASLRRLPGIEVVVIPNGVEIPEKISHVHGHGVLRLLYLGRLHPKKGIDNLLAACKILKDSHCAFIWRLTIAGTGDQRYTESLMARIDEWALAPHVKMIGEVVGNAKQGLFEHTDLVVVPSYTENFGMVIAEALAHGVPVIASTGTPWRWLEEKNCGLWVNNDPESLANAIKQMSLMPLREMGDKGRLFVQERFGWENVAKNMIHVYDHSINSTPLELINS